MCKPIKSYSVDELKEIMKEGGLPAFRVEQLLSWIYVKNAQSYDDMTNLPKVMREQFSEAYPLQQFSVREKLTSTDGSRKYLIEFSDGVVVETVGLPASDDRLTVCCSTQAGCPMGCVFCATGKAGFNRNLLPGEIVDQVRAVQDDFGKRVTNVVVMGQGEPFANYDNMVAALRILNHPKLLNIGARHITVSTCGIISGIERFMDEPEQFTLAISLHAVRQSVRDVIMPAMRSQRLGTLRKTLEAYTEVTGRRISFEYALMKGINDSQEDLEALITYCRRLLCHVNLIPLNQIEESDFYPVDTSIMLQWKQELEKSGIAVSIRKSMGSDIDGACGQLAGKR